MKLIPLALLAGGVAMAATATLAQDGVQCGGINAPWIGGSAQQSDITGASAPFERALAVPVSGDLLTAFRVSGTDTQSLRIEAAPPGQDGDPVMRLIDSTGAVVEENDDAGGSLSSRIERTLPPGDYCVAVSSMSESAFNAVLRIGQDGHEPLFRDVGSATVSECNADTPAESLAQSSLDEALAQGAIRQVLPSGEGRFLRFSLGAPMSLTLRASSEQLDPFIVLFDGAGNRIAENDDDDGLNARLDLLSTLGAGDYCLGITSMRDGSGTIEVVVEQLDEATVMARGYNDGTIVPPADGGHPIESIDLAGASQKAVLLGRTAKWFTFELREPSVMIIGAYGSLAGADPRLALFGTHNELMAENDDFGDSRDARVGPLLLEPGRYSVALTNFGQGEESGGRIRPVSLVFDRFVRAP